MKIVLVSMPWNILETPSLPLGLLRARARSCPDPHEISDYYGNLKWAKYLLEKSSGEITPDDYSYIANWGVWHGMGDWVFASVLYDSPNWKADAYQAYLAERHIDPGRSFAMREYARGFVAAAAAEILASKPDLVGFSSTFQQNVPSLAVARRLKNERPDLPVVFGGGNCEGQMGAALHRNFSFLDYVVSGEGEVAFVALLDALGGKRALSGVPGLCWRRPDGRTVSNAAAPMVPMNLVPTPDYSAWFDALRSSGLRDHVQPKLLYEAARGCWWGQKHQCTFCGLNGTTMAFRARPAEQVWDAIKSLVTTYQMLDVVMVDNIMDPHYMRELLPLVRDAGWDLRFYCEVKANLRPDQLELFSHAGVSHIQPGIENLSSQVLSLIDKGVHATQNVQVLRDCEINQMTVDWNYLYGFPGEDANDYRPVIEQLPALVHLQPPSGATRIILERFSPYFEQPDLGFADRQPAEFYKYIYDLSPQVLADIAYQFATPPVGITGETEDALAAAVAWWRDNYAASSLVYRVAEGIVHIYDTRAGWPQRRIVLDDPMNASAYLLLMTPRSVTGLIRDLADQGFTVNAGQLRAWIAWAREEGLVFEEGDRVVALATDRPAVRASQSLAG